MKDFAVLFDLNGTLADTEIAYFNAYKEALRKYGINFKIEDFTSNWSTKGKKLKDYLIDIKREDLLVNEQEILQQKNRLFQTMLETKAKLMPGAKTLLERLNAADIIVGLDSSASRKNINSMLTLFHIQSFIKKITSGDMELDESKYGERKKKSSRLKALADMLGYPYEKCVVIGDSPKDIKGAKDAGMKAIAVPSVYTKNNDFSKADKVVENLDKIMINFLNSLFI